MSATSALKVSTIRQGTDYLSLELFHKIYDSKEDGFKYEWNDGKVEKTTSINQAQAVIQAVLMRLFVQTITFKEGGLFTSETDMNTSSTQLRRPDLAIYTAFQLAEMKRGENQIAKWVAEIISDTDNINRVQDKLEEYFRAGVQVVWHIFPHSRQVYVFTSPEKVEICRGEKYCTAAPAFPDFNLPAKMLFE